MAGGGAQMTSRCQGGEGEGEKEEGRRGDGDNAHGTPLTPPPKCRLTGSIRQQLPVDLNIGLLCGGVQRDEGGGGVIRI